MAKRGGGSGRKYVRDNRGRFSSTGATARGGRLKTASGKKRAVQTVKAKTGGKPAGALKAKPRSEGQKYAKRVQAGKDLKRSQSTAREKKFFAETQKRLDAAPLAQSRSGVKAKSVTANSARATGKLARPVAKGNIRRTGGRLGPKNTIKAGPKSPRTKMNRAIDNVIKKGKALKGSADKLRGVKKQADALRGRMLKEDKGRLGKALSKPSVTDKRSRDYGGRLTKGARGQDAATGGKKGKAKPAAAKPATKLKRSGEKIGVNSLKTNKEQGRKGIVSMSSRAKAVRKGDVAERKSARMSRIAERQSEIVARRQGRRASNYNPDGTFNQSTANANQRRLGRSKQLQEKLRSAGGGKNIASKALSKRRKPVAAKPAARSKPTAAKPAAAKPARKSQLEAGAKRNSAKADKIDAKVARLEKDYRSKGANFYTQPVKTRERDRMYAKMQQAAKLRKESSDLRTKSSNAQRMASKIKNKPTKPTTSQNPRMQRALKNEAAGSTSYRRDPKGYAKRYTALTAQKIYKTGDALAGLSLRDMSGKGFKLPRSQRRRS